MTTTVPINRDGASLPKRSASLVGESADAPPLVEVRNISKRFGALQALSDVSLKLCPLEFAHFWAKTARAKALSSNASWARTGPTAAR